MRCTATSRACAWSCRRRPYDAKGLLTRALRCDDPVLFLEHREVLGLKGPVPEEEYEIEFGRAAVVREGTDVTVVALALMVHEVLKAAEILRTRGDLGRAGRPADGRAAGLRDDPRVGPQDGAAADRRRGRSRPFGVGAEIAARMADAGFDDLDAPIRRLNGVHTPTPYSPPLEAAVVPNVGRDRPGRPRPDPGVSPPPWPSRSPSPGSAGTWTRASSSAGSSATARPSARAIRCSPSRARRRRRTSRRSSRASCGSPPTAPAAGEVVAVGTVIGYLLGRGRIRAGSLRRRVADRSRPCRRPSARRRRIASQPARDRSSRRGDRPRSSPLARRLARELGIDWTRLVGSGCTGRIRKVDVLAAAGRGTIGTPRGRADRGESIPIGPTRRTIAARMVREPAGDGPRDADTTVGRDEPGEPPRAVQGGRARGPRAAGLPGVRGQAGRDDAARAPDAARPLGRAIA